MGCFQSRPEPDSFYFLTSVQIPIGHVQTTCSKLTDLELEDRLETYRNLDLEEMHELVLEKRLRSARLNNQLHIPMHRANYYI